MKKDHLTLIKTVIPYEQRIQNRIDSFRRDILDADDSMEHIQKILDACFEYMVKYEDDDIVFSCIKLKESLMYLNNFINYEE